MTDLRKAVLNLPPKKFGFSRIPHDFTPLEWNKYFDEKLQVTTKHGTFQVYKKGTLGPMLCCLHGGGYSGLTWALFAEEVSLDIECQVVAIDLRGHGNTSTDDDKDLSLEVLAQDVSDVVEKLCENCDDVPVVLIGHSMGGAIAVSTSHILTSVVGLCVIDVVEGTAMEALSSMQNFLRSRPTGFKSLEQAIQWSYKSGQTKNIEAARISMPGQVVKVPVETQKPLPDESQKNANGMNSFVIEEVEENEETTTEVFSKPPLPKPLSTTCSVSGSALNEYVWRIDLKKTESHWSGWFKGLSQRFLDLSIPKILLLANINGLDTALTVGQMQGKFQFQVLSKSGHAVHEDQPHQVAEIVSMYLVKHKLAVAKTGFVVFKPFI